MELGELHRTIHGRTAEREVASGEMYRKTKKARSDDCHKTSDLAPPRAGPSQTLMAPAPAVDKWGADGFKTKLPPPAGVLTGIKNSSLPRGQRTRENVSLSVTAESLSQRVARAVSCEVCDESAMRM